MGERVDRQEEKWCVVGTYERNGTGKHLILQELPAHVCDNFRGTSTQGSPYYRTLTRYCGTAWRKTGSSLAIYQHRMTQQTYTVMQVRPYTCHYTIQQYETFKFDQVACLPVEEVAINGMYKPGSTCSLLNVSSSLSES